MDFVGASTTPDSKLHRLQILYFFIDRHWSKLLAKHESEDFEKLARGLVNTIPTTLTILRQQEGLDAIIHSWSLLCSAVIAKVYASTNRFSTIEIKHLWSEAITNLGVSGVCRVACHVASTLLSSLPSMQEKLLEDMDNISRSIRNQGPHLPYDSTCTFFVQLLTLAAKDIRLYRFHLDDVVLSWLSEKWRYLQAGNRQKLDPYTVGDVQRLLETCCALAKSVMPFTSLLLPDDVVTCRLTDISRTEVIRRYLRQGVLSSHNPHTPSTPTPEPSLGSQSSTETRSSPDEDSPPRPNDTKVSSWLLQTLETLAAEWSSESEPSSTSHTKLRSSIDMVVLALCFQVALKINGIRFNTRVLKAACQLVVVLTPLFELRKWTQPQRAIVLLGLEPLVSLGRVSVVDELWQVMLAAGENSGISRGVLLAAIGGGQSTQALVEARRREAQTVLWATDVSFAIICQDPLIDPLF